MKKLLLTAVVLLLAGFTVKAQDIHFSQYLQSPLNLNPGLTGMFDGAYRFVGNQRRQWASVSDNPYQTLALSADANNFLRMKNIGVGLSMFSDIAGDSHFGTTQVNLSGSYLLKLNDDSTQFLSGGIQVGFSQRKIDYTELTFDEQYNGYKWEDIPISENFVNQGRTYPNVAVGAVWRMNIEDRKYVSAGAALHNITKPQQSFFGNTDIVLDRRVSAFGGGQFMVAEKWDILPRALYMHQGNFDEIVLGASGKYYLENQPYKYTALYIGLDWRISGGVTNPIESDAGFITAALDYNTWNFGLSYDINVSSLRPASGGRGGFEFSVIYIIRNVMPKRLKYKICPNFI